MRSLAEAELDNMEDGLQQATELRRILSEAQAACDVATNSRDEAHASLQRAQQALDEVNDRGMSAKTLSPPVETNPNIYV